ncbi:MAG: branched-chain amino acid ABC transporter substrate-binding protein [Anaerolineae bacterium]|nr:branched-chain amino acid ABC transporter substrate-binding protein [Anaerolineae bacterium]
MGKYFLIFIIIAALSLPACGSMETAGAPATLKIGLVAPFEGLHRPLGYEALFGVKLALQEQNLAGGVGGYRIELVAVNDFDDPLEAEAQARALIADPGVVGVIGHLSSAATQAALPVYRKADLAVVIPWSVTAEVDLGPSGVVSVAANLAETEAQLKTVGQALGFEQITPLTHSGFDSIPAGTQALSLNTEGVTAGERLVSLRQADITLPVLGQVETGSPQTLQVAREAAAGFIFVSPSPDPRQMNEAASFVAAYQALAGFPPGPRALLAYDATQVLLEAIKQSMSDNNTPVRAKVGVALVMVQHQGLSGLITFDRLGRRVAAPVWVYQITDNTYPGVLVTP